MRRDTIIQYAAAATCIACLGIAGTLSTRISASAGRHRLVYADRASDAALPQVGIGIAMGAFRGLFVNMLWIRANNLKEEGKFHEAMTLARAITQLQPRFPQVWVFHAWNMAYNISVSSQNPEERWQWVNRGVDLLRSEGVVYNPTAMPIFRELGWIFLHKIGGYTDEANQYYKRALAAEWTEILGEPPRLGLRVTEAHVRDIEAYRAALGTAVTTEDLIPVKVGDALTRKVASLIFVAWLSHIDRAPATIDAVTSISSAHAELVSRIRSRIGPRLDSEFLKRYQQVVSYLASPYVSPEADRLLGPKTTALKELLRDDRYAQAWKDLIPHVRKRVLIDEYHMEVPRMIRYTRVFGPIDWRCAGAHALYWTRNGVENALEVYEYTNNKDLDFVNTDRQVIHSIQELYRYGDLYFNYFYWAAPQFRTQRTMGPPQLEGTAFSTVPNPFFIDTYAEVMETLRREDKTIYEDTNERIFTLYSAGYENFLTDVIRFFFRRGQIDLAREYQHKLRTFKGVNLNDYEKLISVYAADINTFIAKQFEDERFSSPYVAVSEVEAALQGAYIALLSGDDEIFRNSFEYAREYHRAYREKQMKVTAPSGGIERMGMFSRDFREQAGVRFADFIAALDLTDAETVYTRAPNDLKQWAYFVLTSIYSTSPNADIALGTRSFDEVFPEPEGMEEFLQYINRIKKQDEARTPMPTPPG